MRKLAVALAVVLCLSAASGAWASVSPEFQRLGIASLRSPGNSSLETYVQTTMAIMRSFNLALNQQMTNHAAPAEKPMKTENEWFRDFNTFLEYGYADSRERRGASIDSDIHSTTVGFSCRTACDIVAGMMYNYQYSNGDGHAAPPGQLRLNANSDANTVTFFAAKNFDPVVAGVSFSFGHVEMRNTGVLRVTSEVDTFVLAPYVGLAAYQQGPLTATSTLSYIFRWQDFSYGGIVAPGDDSSDGTLVLMNRVNYAVNDQCAVTGIFDWNRVLQHEPTEADEDSDHCWFTVGARVGYWVSQTCEVYFSYTADLGNESFENHFINLGVSMDL